MSFWGVSVDTGAMSDLLRNPSPRIVTMWSDVGCPWASLALHTLQAAAARAGVQLMIDHRAFPLELFNRRGTPKPIIDAEVVAIAGLRPELGWRPWTAPDSTYPVTTLPAMAAVQAAKVDQVGGLVGSDELDAALRHAFYADGRCISILSEIIEIAATCPSVDADALNEALALGAGIREVHEQWRTAQRPCIAGSPHLFISADHTGLNNPGVDYHWTAPPQDGGVPRFVGYDPQWADELVAELARR